MKRSTRLFPAVRASSMASLKCDKSNLQVMFSASSVIRELATALSSSKPARKHGLLAGGWQQRHSPVLFTVLKPRTELPEKQLLSKSNQAQTRRLAAS